MPPDATVLRIRLDGVVTPVSMPGVGSNALELTVKGSAGTVVEADRPSNLDGNPLPPVLAGELIGIVRARGRLPQFGRTGGDPPPQVRSALRAIADAERMRRKFRDDVSPGAEAS